MPEDLRQAAAALDDERAQARTTALAELYAAYLDWLGPHRVDPALRLKLLRERLEQTAWLRAADVWVDGFAGFTGQELLTLVTLGRLVRRMDITLMLAPEEADVPADGPRLFRRPLDTLRRLRAELEAGGVDVLPPVELSSTAPPRFAELPAVAALERYFVDADADTPFDATPASGPSAPDGAPGDHLRVVAAESPREEARLAARFIRRQLIDAEGRLRFRDFAVIARDLTPLADVLAEVFDEYEIPYFLDRRRPMRGHPLGRLMRGLCDAAVSNGEAATMIGLLQTNLLPIAVGDAERLVEVLRRCEVRGLGAWRQRVWRYDERLATLTRDRSTMGRMGEEPAAVWRFRQRLAAALDPLAALVHQDQPPTGAEWARRLYDVLAELDVPRHIARWIGDARRHSDWDAAETHRAAWEALCEVLSNVADVLIDTHLGATELNDVLSAALDEITLGLAPPTLDQVLISSIDRSRHPEIKHAWLIAFNEGVFPSAAGERRSAVNLGARRPDRSRRGGARAAPRRCVRRAATRVRRVDAAGAEPDHQLCTHR